MFSELLVIGVLILSPFGVVGSSVTVPVLPDSEGISGRGSFIRDKLDRSSRNFSM